MILKLIFVWFFVYETVKKKLNLILIFIKNINIFLPKKSKKKWNHKYKIGFYKGTP